MSFFEGPCGQQDSLRALVGSKAKKGKVTGTEEKGGARQLEGPYGQQGRKGTATGKADKGKQGSLRAPVGSLWGLRQNLACGKK